jgi:hypothetical protein
MASCRPFNSLEEFPRRGLAFVPIDVSGKNPRCASVRVHKERVAGRERRRKQLIVARTVVSAVREFFDGIASHAAPPSRVFTNWEKTRRPYPSETSILQPDVIERSHIWHWARASNSCVARWAFLVL